jgi:hypothetical protein
MTRQPNQLGFDPTAWHKAPEPDRATCSVCALARKYFHVRHDSKAHRSWRPTDPPGVEWMVRTRMNSTRAIKRKDGELVEELLTPEDARERIRQVAARVLLGIPRKEIARALGITLDALRSLLRKYPATLEAALAEVRTQGPAGVLQPIEKKPRIPPHVRRLIGQAVALVASGKKEPEVIVALELLPHTIDDWRVRYRTFWHAEVGRAVEVAQALQKQLAGTPAALGDPDRFMAQSHVCERVRPVIVPDVPLSDQMTLSELYECYYKPARLKDAAPQTVTTYGVAMRKWKAFTGDPSLRDITVNTLMVFRDAVECMAGNHLARRSAWSVKQALSHIQYVLDRAGPPEPRRRDCLGLLKQVPYLRPPRIFLQLPRPVPNDVLDRLYRAAGIMDRPRIPGLSAVAWWRCLLAVALNAGLRSETLFIFLWEHVKLDEGRLEIPAEFMKTRMPIVLPLNRVAVHHLRSIYGHVGRVFPWPHGRSAFYEDWHRLHDGAGIPRAEHYKLKQVRKSLGTLLWESDPAAAQLMLGHGSDKTTRDFYVSRHILHRAMQALPQPAAFIEGMKQAT